MLRVVIFVVDIVRIISIFTFDQRHYAWVCLGAVIVVVIPTALLISALSGIAADVGVESIAICVTIYFIPFSGEPIENAVGVFQV